VAAPAVARGMARGLGWNDARVRDEIHAWDQMLREEERLIARAREGR
jgi:hypothetical protein